MLSKKGILTNKGYKIITNVLWVVAIVSCIVMGIAIWELKVLTNELRTELSK